MSWVIILVIIGVIIFFFLKDRDKMLETQVDNSGGMVKKYSGVVEYLTNDPNAEIVQVKRDHIHIKCKMPNTVTHFFITEIFDGVRIEWSAELGPRGNHKKNWEFPKTTSQEEIVNNIGTDLQKL